MPVLSQAITPARVLQVLDLAYERALGGAPGLASAQDLAKDYLSRGGNRAESVDALIRWQVAKAAASGLVTGVGGLLAIPVTLPLNLTSVLYVQVRMIGAIAWMGGYALDDDRVKTLSYICLCGNGAKEVLKSAGVALGQKLSQQVIQRLSQPMLAGINRAVGFRLLTHCGQAGLINLGRAMPLAGGLLGGALDAMMTRTVGIAAKRTFIIDEVRQPLRAVP
jgi:hypothetical protein